jgi:hypothetical protein
LRAWPTRLGRWDRLFSLSPLPCFIDDQHHPMVNATSGPRLTALAKLDTIS